MNHNPEQALLHEHPFSQLSNQSQDAVLIRLDQQLLDLELHTINNRLKLRGFIGCDGARNDGAGNSTSTTQGNLAVLRCGVVGIVVRISKRDETRKTVIAGYSNIQLY